MASKDSAITVNIILNDPEIDSFRNMLLANNLLKFNHRQFYPGGITERDRKMAQTLDFSQQALLNDFIRRRVEKLKESEKLKKMKREKKELKKKKKGAETTLVDGDEDPSKKLKLVQVQDNHANEKETMNLEAVSSDVDLENQGVPVPSYEPVGNSMAEGLNVYTRQADKKNDNVDQSTDR